MTLDLIQPVGSRSNGRWRLLTQAAAVDRSGSLDLELMAADACERPAGSKRRRATAGSPVRHGSELGASASCANNTRT
jgi:hypothetical protein